MRLAMVAWQLIGELLLIGQAIEVKLAGAVPEQWESKIPFCVVLADPRQDKFFWYMMVLFQHTVAFARSFTYGRCGRQAKSPAGARIDCREPRLFTRWR